MVVPKAAMVRKNTAKELFSASRVESEEDEDSDDMQSDDRDDESESSEDEGDEVAYLMQQLKDTWKRISPPNEESEIKYKWYAVEYHGKRLRKRGQLLIGKLLSRSLEEDGTVKLEMRCLKPKVGSGTELDDTPQHLPDVGYFALKDVIRGPIDVIPKRSNKFEVPEYEDIATFYNKILTIDWRLGQ